MLYLILGLLGLSVGSFVNALVWRLKNKRDWVHERSECVRCGHQLAALDLVPVLSWLLLKGRCRYCKKPISIQYPLVEAATASLFVLSYLHWPEGLTGSSWFQFGLWLVLLTILVALAVYDILYMLLPNKLVWPAGIVVAGWVLLDTLLSQSIEPVLEAVFGLAVFGGLFYVLFQASNGKWIGGGDVKLGFVLGAWLGSAFLGLFAIFTASVIGVCIAGILTFSRKVTLTSRLPFGPMLIAGTIIATLYGERFLNTYTQLVLGG